MIARRPPLAWLVAACAGAALSWLAPAQAVVFQGPAPYLSFADSPYNGGAFNYFLLETFEDGALDTPGASASGSWTVLAPGPQTDSVDADDGAIDGSGTGGHSFFSKSENSTLTITFSAAALGGHLPTHVGIVWTDVGLTSGTQGLGAVAFSAVDGLGASLGSIGPFNLGDLAVEGGTAEDRFFGVVDPGGILSITISIPDSNDWEVDHLQYGFAALALPEPGPLSLFGAALLALWAVQGSKKG